MEVVVNEMLQLSSVQMYDAYQGAPFQLKVDILLYILNCPRIGKMFNISGSGAYKACLWCDIKGKCVHVEAIDRVRKHACMHVQFLIHDESLLRNIQLRSQKDGLP